jgi:aerobic-type carbon monoxide dehydrogenase small subunit (CoxS/CutS family)
MLAVQADGSSITTIEGLAQGQNYILYRKVLKNVMVYNVVFVPRNDYDCGRFIG